MHQTSKNLKSTNPKDPKRQEESPITPLAQRINTVLINIIYNKRQIATGLTGKFPVTSNRGNKNIFALYEYDINRILVLPMKSRTYSEFTRVFKDLHVHLITRVTNTVYMRL